MPGLRGQVDHGCVGDSVFADVLDEPSFHQVVVPFLQCSFGLVEIALVAEDIRDLTKRDPVIVLVDQIVADDDEDHPVVIVLDLQPVQLPDKSDLGIGLEEFLQLMVQFSGSDGIVVQILVQVIQTVEEFMRGQAGLFRLFRDFIVLECPDDSLRDIEGVLVLRIMEFEIPGADQGVEFITVFQRADIADVQVPGDIVEVDVPWPAAKADRQQHRLQRRDAEPGCEVRRLRLVVGPEFVSELGIVGPLRQVVHQLENRLPGLLCVVLVFHLSSFL